MTPTFFAHLLEKGQHEHSLQEVNSSPRALDILSKKLNVFPLDREALESILPLDLTFNIEDYADNLPVRRQFGQPKQHSSSSGSFTTGLKIKIDNCTDNFLRVVNPGQPQTTFKLF